MLDGLIQAHYLCAFCGERNDVAVDPSEGEAQEYTEDCQVCCRPNVLRVVINPETGHAAIEAENENE